MQYSGMTASQASTWVTGLLDYQDNDKLSRLGGNERGFKGSDANYNRNGKIPDLSDLWFMGLTQTQINGLKSNATIYKKGYFNPVNASKELLTALTNEQVANQAITLRKEKPFNKRTFSEVTGFKEGNDVFFYPSNNVRFTFKSEFGEAIINKELTVQFKPYAKYNNAPFKLISIKE